jgi:Ca2+-binding RTX toxin-like protein
MALKTGTQQADLLLGTAANDVFVGLNGNDTILGRLGDDSILAGAGDDSIFGDNSFDYPLPDPNGNVQQSGPIWAGPNNPSPGNNLIFAGAGNDVVIAGYGSNTVCGGAGNDTILGWGSVPVKVPQSLEGRTSYLFGGSGNDSIEGGSASDVLNGGAGADILLGFGGADTLTGGSGRDIFKFGRVEFTPDTGVGPGNRDIITDFHHRQDVIDLTSYRNIFPPPEGQPGPIFLGTGSFEATFALQVRYDIVDGNTVVQINAPFGFSTDNPAPTVPTRPSQEIELSGIHHLTASDFILPPGFGDYVL